MTAHRVVASDEFDGIALACLHPDCDWTERGFGHSETAWPVARLHEAEARVDAMVAVLRRVAAHFDGTDAPLGVAARELLAGRPDASDDEKERRAA